MVLQGAGTVNSYESKSLELADKANWRAAHARFYVGNHEGLVILKVQSKTDSTKRYEVTLVHDHVTECTCIAGSYHKPCIHAGAALKWIARRNAWEADHREETGQTDTPPTAA
jgi:hypothetical protein